MAKCAHFEVCGIEADTIPEGGHCILHAQDPDKDREAFAEALEKHLATGTGDFRHIHFCGTADFQNRTFEEGASFYEATFSKEADFSYGTFRGSALFEGSSRRPLFACTQINFNSVTLDPLDAVAFRNADLSQCRFLNTDVRGVEFTSVKWCRKPSRWLGGKGTVCVYDELVQDDAEKPWGRLERLYRELKQNYEDRRDYGRAGDFHFREKEMRRRNPGTPPGHKVLLWLYWALSGYGERIWPAMVWLFAVVLGCAAAYLAAGIAPTGAFPLAWSGEAYGSALLYSAQTSFLVRPDGYVLTESARWVRLFQTVLSPILLGLIALAVRQRLKR